MDIETTPKPAVTAQRAAKTKRQFTAQFKARIVKLCEQPGAVLAHIARDHSLVPNVVGRWVREHHVRERIKGFVPVEMAAPAASTGEIRIECTRGKQTIVVTWPTSAAKECAQWLRDWLA